MFGISRFTKKRVLLNNLLCLVVYLFAARCGDAAAGSLAFSASSYTISENTATATITVQRWGVASAAASVTIVSADGTAKAGEDFNAVNQNLSWGIGDLIPKTFTVTLKDDSVAEGTENFTLKFTSPVGDGTGGDVLVKITDYEEGKFQFSSASYSGNEESLQLVTTVSRVSGSDGPASVKLKTSATGTPAASNIADYTDIDVTVAFLNGETSKNVVIPLKDDSTAELPEFFTLTLSAPTNAILGTPVSANAEINDTDSDFTSTLKLLTKTTKNVAQTQLVDLTQNSLLDTQKKILDLVNTIPILTLTELEVKQDTDGLMTIDVEKDKVYLRPIAVKRSAPGSSPAINVRDDINSTFATSQGWFVEATPALALKGLSVFQKELATIFLPDLVIVNNGNITIQVDQGAPPFERDANNNVVVNYRFYDRWNLRPSMIATETNATEEGFSLIPHPMDKKEVVIAVVYADAVKKRQQILSSAPIDGPELIQELKSKGINRCVGSSGTGCTIVVTNPRQQNYGIVTFDIESVSATTGKKQTLSVTVFADYKIRKTPNFLPSMVGFSETNDINRDSFADYKMIYGNGEEQNFFFVSSILK